MKRPVSFMDKMQPAPLGGGFRMEGYWVWCGSPIRGEDGRYHLFASRWPKALPMHPGWLLASEIVRAVSDTPGGPYHYAEVVLPARGPAYWDGRSTHNPSIRKCGGEYVLYYTGMTHPFSDPEPGEDVPLSDHRVIASRASKRVGIAVASSLEGPWERFDGPVLPTRPDRFDNLMTSNPAPCILADGSVLLVYKARAYKKAPYTGELHEGMTLGVATAPHVRGPYTRADYPLFQSEQVHLEDPFIWQGEDGGYYLIAKDMDGNVCGEKHAGVSGWSSDGFTWNMNQGIRAYSREILWDNGQARRMGSLERPAILFEDGKATHLFFATADGPGGFRKAENTWNMAIPLDT